MHHKSQKMPRTRTRSYIVLILNPALLHSHSWARKKSDKKVRRSQRETPTGDQFSFIHLSGKWSSGRQLLKSRNRHHLQQYTNHQLQDQSSEINLCEYTNYTLLVKVPNRTDREFGEIWSDRANNAVSLEISPIDHAAVHCTQLVNKLWKPVPDRPMKPATANQTKVRATGSVAARLTVTQLSECISLHFTVGEAKYIYIYIYIFCAFTWCVYTVHTVQAGGDPVSKCCRANRGELKYLNISWYFKMPPTTEASLAWVGLPAKVMYECNFIKKKRCIWRRRAK